MKTVMITGCSSGFGLETAQYFLAQGWKVIATMRKPDDAVLPPAENLQVLALDVTSEESIKQAVEAAGEIDVLVNNAGIGWLNAVEATSMDIVRQIFETNTFGTIALTQAFLPQFRARKSGVIINVTSSVTLKPLLMLAVYSASKAAVNAFTDSLALELAPFNVQARVVLPGRAPTTKFGQNAGVLINNNGGFHDAYNDQIQSVFANFEQEPADMVTHSEDVAEAVWQAATDPNCPTRLPAGADAVALSK
ncbi:SDR family oxidoreductase [Thalassospira marina]|uniref:Short-chain dehydrogenase/reductase n=1 Tax=Thalassospira marina TaxID=2048283 RepID=A0ABN5FAU6_9PROT|nr:SDR family oxidoreductase [Thalassospira marina]AUG51848.1 short-chain dehydrogenase/reductase [Thalassospira marina]